MIKPLTIWIIALGLLSCNNSNYTPDSDYHFIFFPRECKVVFADNAQFQVFDEGSQWEYRSYDTINNSQVNAGSYVLFLTTSNTSLIPEEIQLKSYNPIQIPRYELWRHMRDNRIDEPNAEIERQIRESYNRVYKKESVWVGLPIEMDYRFNEVKKITISCNAQLFEQPGGSSLNQFFKMRHPAYVFTSPDQMVVGYGSDVPEYITIDNYLNYNPLIHPGLYLYLTYTPPEAPLETRFIVEMDMANGDILRDTTEIVRLLP